MDIRQRVRDAFLTLLDNEGIKVDKGQLNEKFLEVDSLIYIKFIFALEAEFQIEIDNETLMNHEYTNLDDIADLLVDLNIIV